MALSSSALSAPSDRTAPPGGAPASPLADERPPPARNPNCVSFSAQAVYRSGYEHRVHIENGCNKMVSCEVNTDVTPAIITARIDAHSRETLLTRRGSPASTFVAHVVCKLVR